MYNKEDRLVATVGDYNHHEVRCSYVSRKTDDDDSALSFIRLGDLIDHLTYVAEAVGTDTTVLFDTGSRVDVLTNKMLMVDFIPGTEFYDDCILISDNNKRVSNTLTFSEALEAVKAGKRITREGWNGKGLFVVYQKGYPDGIPCNKQTAEAWGMNEGELFKCDPYLQINTTDGSHAMWVPSIRDCLAEDWMILE